MHYYDTSDMDGAKIQQGALVLTEVIQNKIATTGPVYLLHEINKE